MKKDGAEVCPVKANIEAHRMEPDLGRLSLQACMKAKRKRGECQICKMSVVGWIGWSVESVLWFGPGRI